MSHQSRYFLWIVLFLPLLLTVQATISGATHTLKSPNGFVIVQLSDAGGNLIMSQSFRGKPTLIRSRLGLLVDGLDFSAGVTIGTVTARSVDDTWNAINEKVPKSAISTHSMK